MIKKLKKVLILSLSNERLNIGQVVDIDYGYVVVIGYRYVVVIGRKQLQVGSSYRQVVVKGRYVVVMGRQACMQWLQVGRQVCSDYKQVGRGYRQVLVIGMQWSKEETYDDWKQINQIVRRELQSSCYGRRLTTRGCEFKSCQRISDG